MERKPKKTCLSLLKMFVEVESFPYLLILLSQPYIVNRNYKKNSLMDTLRLTTAPKLSSITTIFETIINKSLSINEFPSYNWKKNQEKLNHTPW